MTVKVRGAHWGVPRLVLVALVALLLALLAGCGSDDSDSSSASTGAATTEGGASTSASTEGGSDRPARIAFFGLAAENAYTQYMYRAAEAEAKRLGAEIEFFDGRFEGPTQVNQVQDAITSENFDAFIIMPNDQAGIVPVTEQAIARGIRVSALQFPIGPDATTPRPQVEGLTTSVIEDVIAGGRITAEGINAMCVDRDPCKVGILWGSRKVTWDGPAKRPAMEAALDPNVEIVAEADGGFLQGPGERATADMLSAHPDLDVLATPSGDQMTLGGERAIAAAGRRLGLADRPRGDIAIIGYGASEAGVQRVIDRNWYSTYALVPQSMAAKLTEMMVAAVRGEPVETDGIGQTEISPVGDNITLEVLAEHPDFRAEWVG